MIVVKSHSAPGNSLGAESFLAAGALRFVKPSRRGKTGFLDLTLNSHRSTLNDLPMSTILLLIASNVFMTLAWYGHLNFKESALPVAILVSWGIAFFEYCLQVPANRWGHGQFTAPQLKIIQEVITLLVFGVFSMLFLKEKLRWNELAGFVLILAAVAVVFGFKETKADSLPEETMAASIEISKDS